ncbi:CRISPR-associated protein Cas4 [Candidatus Thiomargarita nelsonii]|uniref:CRISPR-associated protein Cas4 n=1 Tax=Candidatus Thiomargarita nelsonii TaxID=1003181 RepID=A0A0A6P442_9GAMM|nr:CRISPR-associated protein Cas4 [Candidatus Thiomargarita nelsonii]
MIQNWTHQTAFYERVERLNLYGLHFQHVALCQRRAWMYLHNINFAQWHERVATGSAKHLTSYGRDHSTEGLFGLAPDRIDWKQRIVFENKGTAGAVEASHNQTAFYAVILSIVTGQEWQAVTHILSSRKRRPVLLDEKRLQSLWEGSEQLESLAKQSKVPNADKIRLCGTCSLMRFCGYD